MLSFALILMFALDATTPPAAAPIPPAARPPSARGRALDQWELEYQAGPVRLYKDGESGEAFWYATYTIVNRTSRDRSVAPQWELLDEEGRLFSAGEGVPRRVYRAVQSLLANPLHEDQSAIIGDIMPGEENAKSGFVIWKVGPEVRRFSILVTGLSNIKKPATDPVTKKPIVLKKTRRLDYQMACDRASLIGEVPMATMGDEPNPRWIMR
ncbi:MAG: hypothetical protein K8R92_10465 [Planctomycetes bacterium]|nr:hypothetical protein [Planctomycetota bacterium]